MSGSVNDIVGGFVAAVLDLFSVTMRKHYGKSNSRKNEFVCLAEWGSSPWREGGNSSRCWDSKLRCMTVKTLIVMNKFNCFSLYLFIQSSINIPIGKWCHQMFMGLPTKDMNRGPPSGNPRSWKLTIPSQLLLFKISRSTWLLTVNDPWL